jgi:porin
VSTVAALLVLMSALPLRADEGGDPPKKQSLESPAQENFGGAIERDAESLEAAGTAWLEQPYLTGNWGGWRSALVRRGVTLTVSYAADILGNPIGGERHKMRYFQNIGVDLLLDLERLLHVPGARIHASMASRAGSSLSDEDIGNVFNVAELCCQPQTRLVTLAWEQTLFENRLSLRAGHISSGDDFLTSPLYWLFVNSAINGNPGGIFFNVPFLAYPNASLGMRVRVRPHKHVSFQAGVYNGTSDGNGRQGTSFNVHFGDGALVLAEAAYHPEPRLAGVVFPGHYKIGGYYHTGRFPRFDAPPGSDLPSDAEHGNAGWYLLLDQTIYRADETEQASRVTPFLSLLFAPNQEINEMPFFFNGGVVWQRPQPIRPDDAAIFGIMYGGFSSDLRRAERGSPSGQQDFEMVLEWSYVVQLAPWLQVQPDFQYVIKPGGTGNIPDAFVLGTQVAVNF